MPLPHVKQATGGQVFPEHQIDEIRQQEGRDLRRFDVNFDLPDHFTPEFPPPIFLTTHPELGDVSRGQLLTIKNFYELMEGIVTPVQIEGLRLLLTPFPQEEFNQTEDRKSRGPKPRGDLPRLSLQLSHQRRFPPDARMSGRSPLASGSIRPACAASSTSRSTDRSAPFGRSKISAEFEQRTAYFNGDHVSATRKGVHCLTGPTRSR